MPTVPRCRQPKQAWAGSSWESTNPLPRWARHQPNAFSCVREGSQVRADFDGLDSLSLAMSHAW